MENKTHSQIVNSLSQTIGQEPGNALLYSKRDYEYLKKNKAHIFARKNSQKIASDPANRKSVKKSVKWYDENS